MKNLLFNKVAISGHAAVGTTTLSNNLSHELGWEYINVGKIQRAYDISLGLKEHEQGTTAHTDAHERSMDAFTKKTLLKKKNIVYEAWLAGFISREMKDILRVLVICSNFGVRVDRVSNRDNLSIKEARHFIQKREHENIIKWKNLYGDHDFWNPKYFHLIIETAKSGPMETLGIVLDKLGYNRKI